MKVPFALTGAAPGPRAQHELHAVPHEPLARHVEAAVEDRAEELCQCADEADRRHPALGVVGVGRQLLAHEPPERGQRGETAVHQRRVGERGEQQRAAHARIVEDEPDERLDRLLDDCRPVRAAGRDGTGERRVGALGHLVEHGRDQRVPVGEALVEVALGEARAPAHRPDPDRRAALGAQQIEPGIEQRTPPFGLPVGEPAACPLSFGHAAS